MEISAFGRTVNGSDVGRLRSNHYQQRLLRLENMTGNVCIPLIWFQIHENTAVRPRLMRDNREIEDMALLPG
jgi:hypothetical protein